MSASLTCVPETDRADMSLLLLDDNDALRHVLSIALSRRGFEVTPAASVKDALAIIAISAPAYAVLDLSLADGSGLEVAACLRATRPDTQFIIL